MRSQVRAALQVDGAAGAKALRHTAVWLQKEAEMSTAGWWYEVTNGKRCGWRN